MQTLTRYRADVRQFVYTPELVRWALAHYRSLANGERLIREDVIGSKPPPLEEMSGAHARRLKADIDRALRDQRWDYALIALQALSLCQGCDKRRKTQHWYQHVAQCWDGTPGWVREVCELVIRDAVRFLNGDGPAAEAGP